jgi:hypothetical protein
MFDRLAGGLFAILLLNAFERLAAGWRKSVAQRVADMRHRPGDSSSV